MPPTNHSAAIQKSWPTKIGHVQTWPTKVGQRKKLANIYDTRQTFVGQQMLANFCWSCVIGLTLTLLNYLVICVNAIVHSDNMTVLYSSHNEQHTDGDGILLSQVASGALVGWKPVNERIITA